MKNTLLNLDWWDAATIRMIKTMAQTAIVALGSSTVLIQEIDWLVVAGGALGGALLSFLMSLAGLPEVDAE